MERVVAYSLMLELPERTLQVETHNLITNQII
jgi:hypothetical protein